MVNIIDKDDYLLLEDLLIQRLKAEMPELKTVIGAKDLHNVQSTAIADPAAHVVYIGDHVGDGAGNQGATGSTQVVVQQWMVVLVVKFAGADTTGKANRAKAGALISKLLRALSGWQPPSVPFTTLRRINAPAVGYANGTGYYPFAFKTTHVTLGKT